MQKNLNDVKQTLIYLVVNILILRNGEQEHRMRVPTLGCSFF